MGKAQIGLQVARIHPEKSISAAMLIYKRKILCPDITDIYWGNKDIDINEEPTNH